MLVTINKNDKKVWDITPNSGRFQGQVVATAEGIDLTSVVAGTNSVVGTLKAVWGIQIKDEVYDDLETIRALGLGRAFTASAEYPVAWSTKGLYDPDSGKILRRCQRMVILGSSIFRRG